MPLTVPATGGTTAADLAAHVALTGRGAHGGRLHEWLELLRQSDGETVPRIFGQTVAQPTAGRIYICQMYVKNGGARTGLRFYTSTAFAGATDFRVALYSLDGNTKHGESANLGNPAVNTTVSAPFAGGAFATVADTWYLGVFACVGLTAGQIDRYLFPRIQAVPTVNSLALVRSANGYVSGALATPLPASAAEIMAPYLELY